MKLYEFVKHYTLHDAGIERIEYLPEEEKLILEVEVCNCEGHRPPSVISDVDPIPARLVFTGVSRLNSDADLLSLDGDEISGARWLPSSRPTKDILELVVLIGMQRIEDVKLIQIEAEEIHWDIAF
jgi:hypothetical protein